MRVLLETGGVAGRAVALHLHARGAADGSGVSRGYAVWVAGIGTGQEALRQQILLALRVDDTSCKSHAGVKVPNVAVLVVIAGMQFITHAVGKGQAVADAPLVLRKEMVVI